jgi:hypothetical protein
MPVGVALPCAAVGLATGPAAGTLDSAGNAAEGGTTPNPADNVSSLNRRENKEACLHEGYAGEYSISVKKNECPTPSFHRHVKTCWFSSSLGLLVNLQRKRNPITQQRISGSIICSWMVPAPARGVHS